MSNAFAAGATVQDLSITLSGYEEVNSGVTTLTFMMLEAELQMFFTSEPALPTQTL